MAKSYINLKHTEAHTTQDLDLSRASLPIRKFKSCSGDLCDDEDDEAGSGNSPNTVGITKDGSRLPAYPILVYPVPQSMTITGHNISCSLQVKYTFHSIKGSNSQYKSKEA